MSKISDFYHQLVNINLNDTYTKNTIAMYLSTSVRQDYQIINHLLNKYDYVILKYATIPSAILIESLNKFDIQQINDYLYLVSRDKSLKSNKKTL